MKKRILMIEDGRSLVLAVGDRLRAQGYDFEAAFDGTTGLSLALDRPWDLLLVDLMLPGLDGETLIRRVRAQGVPVPVVILSAKNQMADRVAGLRGGADDYITKPFSFDELLARVEAHLRRGPSTTPAEARWLDTGRPDFTFGEFCIRYKSGQLFRGASAVALSHQEFRLLCLFADRPGEVLGTDTILSEAWGYESVVTSRTVYVHVAWLRKKLKSAHYPEGPITTVRGMGYVFQP